MKVQKVEDRFPGVKREIAMRNVCIGLALILAPTICQAQTGSAKGSYAEERGGAASPPINLAYAVALRKDDVEHVLDDDAGIWVLLSDKPVDAKALAGGIFPPATGMARAGAFEGILFVIGKDGRTALNIRVLSRARNPDGGFESLSISGGDLWKSLTIKPASISGAIERDGVRFSFDTAITEDPVQQDIQGVAARATPAAKALIRNSDAWLAGDMAGVEATMSKRRFAELKEIPPAAFKAMVAATRADFANAKKINRVTVRSTTATVKTAAGNYNLVFEDGVWKVG
jgi:hypothetical protein